MTLLLGILTACSVVGSPQITAAIQFLDTQRTKAVNEVIG